MMKAIISLSGGLDSAVLLAHAKMFMGFDVVRAVTFKYPSKHNWFERNAAWHVARHYDTPLQEIDLTNVFQAVGVKSALTNPHATIPEGHYEEETMRQTVVPFRNGIFISVLAGVAESLGVPTVLLATHAGDHYIYPDCRPEFNQAMWAAVREGTDKNVRPMFPFEDRHKPDIVALGLHYGVPLDLTRTCYTSSSVACGRCGSCQERLAAFAANGSADPLPYRDRELLPKKGT